MKRNNKGFTLAELLIVVAIIAVLVAIAIPTFGGQVERAREAADIANLRAAYADATMRYLNGEASPVTVENCTFSQKNNYDYVNTSDLPFTLTGTTTSSITKVTFTFNESATGTGVSATLS